MSWPPTKPNYSQFAEHVYPKPSPRDYIECEIEITDKGDLDKLLFMASNGNRIAFVDRLCVMAFKKHGKCAQHNTRFIFPSSLSVKERQSIHKMQTHSKVRFYETYTYIENGDRKLNLFIKI